MCVCVCVCVCVRVCHLYVIWLAKVYTPETKNLIVNFQL